MGLGRKQEEFSHMHMLLLVFLHTKGYRVRQKHLLRCDDCRVGHQTSLHKLSLAIDLYLAKDGLLLTGLSDYIEAGEYWESIGGGWGGRFEDAFHFSLAYRGMK